MTHMNRREFTVQAGKTTIASMGGIMTLSALNTRKALGANERINMALIGCGGRGRQILQHAGRRPLEGKTGWGHTGRAGLGPLAGAGTRGALQSQSA